MTCPDCGSVLVLPNLIPANNTTQVLSCRCGCSIVVNITVQKHGQPELVKKYREWLSEGRTT